MRRMQFLGGVKLAPWYIALPLMSHLGLGECIGRGGAVALW
jgi:hypothetical protein